MFENISVKTALKMAYEGKAVIYDIRSEEAFKKGHLPMAKNVPGERLWMELNEVFSEKRVDLMDETIDLMGEAASPGGKKPHLSGNNTDWKRVLYCDYGNQSMRLAKELSEAGYRNLASIVGGYHAYEGYVEARKNELWTMEWKERGTGRVNYVR